MTEQAATARSGGVWDMLFTLVFGRRGAPARRPQPAPQPAPQPQPAPAPTVDVAPPAPAPELTVDAAPAPTPEPTVDTAPPEPAPAPGPNAEAQTPIEETPAQPLDPATPAPAVEVPAAATSSVFAQKLVNFCVSEWNSFQQGTLKETQDPAVARIAAYWANVGKEGWDGHTPEPWSAAFISFAMKEAGDNGRFKKATGHCVYINDAIKRRNEPDAPFHGKRIEEYAVQLGDLVCRCRAGSDITFDTAPSTPWYTSHTDIVTAIKPGQVEMIGGNVSNSVSVRRLPLLPDGRLEPGAAAANEVFAILRNNL